MKPYRLSRLAEQDLDEIWTYIAADSENAADRLEARLFDMFERLSMFPGLGHRREDLSPDPTVRFILVARFLVVYRERDEVVEVARVLGAAMDVTGLF